MDNKHDHHETKEIIQRNVLNKEDWQNNITVLDLSSKDMLQLDDNVKLPPNLVELNLSNNKFIEIPTMVLNLEKLKILDISFNNIVLFDDTPRFCHTLECLKLNNNKLEGPPYWVWSERPRNLKQLDLSDNPKICNFFDTYYLEELLHYKTRVNRIELHSCKLGKYMKLLSSFTNARIVILGKQDHEYVSVNHIENIPCPGLEDCTNIEVLDVSNTHIYNIQHNIDMYHNLIEINLSQNNINSVPNEFCNLRNLTVCNLSLNKILYLPDDINKLTKLNKLYLDNNELCMLPENLIQIQSLRILDLYNNHLYEGLTDISQLEQYDFAQNYGDEPDSEEYLVKKQYLRQNTVRLDGSSAQVYLEESEKYEEESDLEWESKVNDDCKESEPQEMDSRCSSPEDWDSDSWWVPSAMDVDIKSTPLYKNRVSTPSPTAMQWLDFVKRKMKEGNFCPMDMHLKISITDKVRYEKMTNPQPQYESDGQFDDYSDDDT